MATGWLRGQGLRRLELLVAAVVLGAFLVWSGAAMIGARRHLKAAENAFIAARTTLAGGQIAASLHQLERAADDVGAARRRAESIPLSLLRPIPLLGSPSAAALAAARAGQELVMAGRVLARASRSFPVSARAGLNGHDLSGFHAASLAVREDLTGADRHLAAARRLLSGPASAALPVVSSPARRLRAEVARVRRRVTGARGGLEVLSAFSARSADLRLLIISQDSLELRPTGGYIGSFGVLRFSHGTAALERYDATEVLPEPQPGLIPPGDLAPWLPKWWGLSNVNWWPDFPATAATAVEMFKRQGGGRVDGVVAITDPAIARLIGAFGRLDVPGYDQPVVANGFQQRVLYEVEMKRPFDQPRKRFLVALSNLLFQRLFDLPASLVPGVARAVDRSVAAGDIQVWFVDAALQRLVAGTSWSGQVPAVRSDFLMLVDANLSASKANLDIRKVVTYRVRRRHDGTLVAHLDVVVEADSALDPYYNGFLRVYVPLDANLVTLRPGQSDDGRAPDAPYRVFSQSLDVRSGSSQRLSFDYTLAASTAPGGQYRLTWLRQVGTSRDELRAEVAGQVMRADPARRTFTMRAALAPNPIAEFVRRRWIVQRLRPPEVGRE